MARKSRVSSIYLLNITVSDFHFPRRLFNPNLLSIYLFLYRVIFNFCPYRFVPYCTSDVWSGKRVEPSKGSAFTFMGALVVKQVVKELLPMGLKNANSMILAGSRWTIDFSRFHSKMYLVGLILYIRVRSAGGVGVMLNLEPVQKLLTRYGTKVKLYGIADSGWFLDQPPFTLNSDIVTPVRAVKQGIAIWRSQVPHTCRMAYPGEQWKCFIGYRIYPTLSGKYECLAFRDIRHPSEKAKSLLSVSSATFCISMAFRRSANGSRKRWHAGHQTTMGVYSYDGRDTS